NVSEQLRRSVVLINSDEALGSGIIIGHNGNDTIILTNRHVIESEQHGPNGAPLLAPGLTVENDERGGRVMHVQLAPNNIDLAIVTVQGDIGPAVRFAKGLPRRGSALLVMGSPLGIEDTLSRGVVSNFVGRTTE